MFKPIRVIAALVATICFLISPPLMAQSKSDGERLFREALQLQGKARSNQDLKTAVDKYAQALNICLKIGDSQLEGRILSHLGAIYRNWGQVDKALEYYDKSLAVSTKVQDRSGEEQALRKIGALYGDWGQYEQAVLQLGKALAIARDLQNRNAEGGDLNSLGIVYYYWGKYDKATDYSNKALVIAAEEKNRRGEAQSLISLGDIYRNIDQTDKAMESFTKALTLASEDKDRVEEGLALHGQGNIYRVRNRTDKAEECFTKSFGIAIDLHDRSLEAASLNNLANVFRARKQYDKAAEYYQKALAIRTEMKNRRWQAIILVNLGLLYSDQRQKDKALEYYEKARKIKIELKDFRGEAGILSDQAELLEKTAQTQKDLEAAVAKSEKAIDVFEKIQSKKGVANVALVLGNIYQDLGRYSKAAEYYRKTVDITRKLNDQQGEGRALNNLGMVYASRDQYDKAVECFTESLTASRKTKDPGAEANALLNLGRVYLAKGEYIKAIRYLKEALTIRTALKDPTEIAPVLNDFGILYAGRGQYGESVEQFEKVLAITTAAKDRRGEGAAFAGLGNIYRVWGRYSKSVEYHEKALTIWKGLKDPEGKATELKNLGNVYYSWGQYRRAVKSYEESLATWRKLKNPKEIAGALNNLGVVYSALEQDDKALSSLQQALGIYSKIGVPSHMTEADLAYFYMDRGDLTKAEAFVKAAGYMTCWGRFNLLKKDYPAARKSYEELGQFCEKNSDINGLFTAYTGLGAVYEGMGDNKKAEGFYLRAVNLTEDLRSSLARPQREKFFDVRINGFLRTAPYDGLARVRMKLNKPQEAFKDSEYTKARVFSEAMSRWSEKTNFDIPADVLKSDKELNEQLAALKKKRQEAYEKGNEEVIAVIEPQVQEMEEKFQANIKMLREKYPLFAATKYPEPMDLDETALKPNEWVLTYHVTDPGIIIYLTKGKEIIKALYKPVPRSDLASLVLEMRKPLQIVPGRDNFKEKLQSFDLVAGKKLSDLLLSDILGSLPPHVPLLVVPDGSLGILPLEMLVLNDKGTIKTDKDLPYISGAKFFGDRNPLSYCQSVTALTLSRIYAKSRSSSGGLLALADPVFQEKDPRAARAPQTKEPQGVLASLVRRLNLMSAEGNKEMGGLRFPRLPLTRRLAKALAGLYRRDSVVYTGFAASKSNFLDNIAPHLNRYGEVVFATHGYLGKNLPGIMEPVLVLTLIPPGTDGYLKMTEVMGLNMKADVVALTACQTGLGKRLAGEGTMGMGRAFQYAGARSVLMSLWSVSEYTSVELVKRFFQHAKSGKTKLESLDLARKEIRDKGFDHPFFWAAFILVGEEN